MSSEDRTRVEEWAALVGETVPEEVTRDRQDRRTRQDRPDRWAGRE
jgi:hypothetical protein